MRHNKIKHKVALLALIILLIPVSCSERTITYGKWKMTSENHEFVLLTDEEAHALGETPRAPWPPDPAPLPSYNERRNLFDRWTRVKDIGEKSQNLKPSLKPYSIVVSASGFAFLQSTKNNIKNESYEDIEWNWKIVLENRSKRVICAYGGYSLLDKDGFVLTVTGTDWDINEEGVCVKAGSDSIIQGRGIWRINTTTIPYPPSRVMQGDYKLFLRHGNGFIDDMGLLNEK